MSAASPTLLLSFPRLSCAYSLLEVITLPLYSLLAMFLGTILYGIRSLWELWSQSSDQPVRPHRAFQPSWEKTSTCKTHGATPKSARKLATWKNSYLVALEVEDYPDMTFLAIFRSPSGFSQYIARAIAKPAGGSTGYGSTAGSGAIPVVRKSGAISGRRANKADRVKKPQGRNGRGDGDDGRKNPRKGGRTRFNSPDGNHGLWACPFCKLNRNRYFHCATIILSRIPDVWQHVKRTHVLSNNEYCNICYADFDQASDLQEHYDRQECVPIGGPEHLFPQDVSRLDGIFRESAGLTSEEGKWYRIWDEIFPGRERPESPYAENTKDFAWQVVASALEPSQPPRFERQSPEAPEMEQPNNLLPYSLDGLTLDIDQSYLDAPHIGPSAYPASMGFRGFGNNEADNLDDTQNDGKFEYVEEEE